MASKRSQIEMSAEEIAAFLDGRHVMNIATNGHNGYPHVVAMWYVMLRESPAFWTFGKSQKMMNLARDPRVTALVEDGDQYSELRGVELQGIAEIVTDIDQIVDIATKVAVRYNGPAAASEQGIAFIRKQAEKRVGVVIDVKNIVSWDHTKLGGKY